MRKLLSVLSSTLQGGVRRVLLLLALFASVSAIYASDTQVDGIWYDFDSSTKTASVTYQGNSYDSYEGEYSGSVVIPEIVTYNGTTYSVTSIGYAAFAYCYALTSVTIPNSVTSIGEYAFYSCSKLTSVTIPKSVTSIGSSAFAGCSSLTSVTINSGAIVNKDYSYDDNISHIFGSQVTEYIIGNKVKGIGNYAFYNCSSLTSVTIPNSVTSIGDNAFRDCKSLSNIVVDKNNTKYDSREDCNAIIETATNTLILGCQNTTIPNSVTSIRSYAFYGCSSLTSVTIGESVTSIGDDAFYKCSSLTSITCEAATPPTLGSDAFDGVSMSIPVYVPDAAVNDYKAAPVWQEFNIQGKDPVMSDVENIVSDNGYGVMENGKIMRNGQLIIIRDGVEYNTLGQAL